MYSKFGKVLAERFQILNHKDEILSGKVKKMKPPPVFAKIHIKPSSSDLTDEILIEESINEPESPVSKKRKPKNSYAFVSQSRDDFYKATDKKVVSPPCNQYDCKYSLVYKSVRVPKFKPRPPTRSRRKTSQSISEYDLSPEKPKARVQSPILFDHQKSRPSITTLSKDVNENRFIKFDDMPSFYSKYKRVSTPNMSKGTERSSLFKAVEQSPDYNPSFKLVNTDLGKVTTFDKYSARKWENHSYRDDLREYNPNYALVERKVLAPNFDKTSSRPASATPLPCYMKNVNWRTALGLMNEKSLEMNSFIEKDNKYSSFT